MQRRPILIVDNEKDANLSLEETLKAEGYATDTADSGQEMLKRIAENNYSLILLDVETKEANVLRELREAKMARPDVPLIIMTENGDVEMAVEALRQGADHYVQKPFSWEEILPLIAELLSYEKQAELVRQNYDNHLSQARQCIDERHLEAAVCHAHKALALDASRPEAFNILGIVMQLRMKVKDAQRYYRAALALDHSFLVAQHNLENITSTPKRLSTFDLG